MAELRISLHAAREHARLLKFALADVLPAMMRNVGSCAQHTYNGHPGLSHRLWARSTQPRAHPGGKGGFRGQTGLAAARNAPETACWPLTYGISAWACRALVTSAYSSKAGLQMLMMQLLDC